MVIINAEANKKIHIGRAGEHNVTQVIFDINQWVEEVKDKINPELGTVELVVNQDSINYLQLVEYNRNERKVNWIITHSNTAKPGVGKCELFYLGDKELTRLTKKPEGWETEYINYYDENGNKLTQENGPYLWDESWENYSKDIPYFYMVRPTLKSAIYEIIVTNALGQGEEEIPAPYESWIDDVLNTTADVKQAKEAAEVALEAAEEVASMKSEIVSFKNAAEAAQKAAEDARDGVGDNVLLSQSWAVGAGLNREDGTPDKEDNAKYYAGLSMEASAKSEQALSDITPLISDAQTYADESRRWAIGENTTVTSDLKSSKEYAEQAKEYRVHPPILREETRTWLVYDPLNADAIEDGEYKDYVDTGKHYNFYIKHTVNTPEELKDIIDVEIGDMAAIQASISDPLNARIYVYDGKSTFYGWKYLFDLSGVGIESITKTKTEGLIDTYTITYSDGQTSNYTVTNGKDGTGSGDMIASKYDPNSSVLNAGGIENYVDLKIQESSTSIIWKHWTASDVST